MRIAAISDTHGNLHALRAVLTDIAARGCDLIVDLGDLVSGPLWPAETADLLMRTGALTVRGNHERQLLSADLDRMGASDLHARRTLSAEQLAWIAALPPTLRVDGDVLLCHGAPDDDLAYLLERLEPAGPRAARTDEVTAALGDVDARLVLCGHTHTPRALRLADGRLCVNPGSVGVQAYYSDWPHPHVMRTGHPAARYAMLRRERGDWHAELLGVDYDVEPAAQLAAQRGHDDWAQALRTGHLD